jgi:hypothetical protein
MALHAASDLSVAEFRATLSALGLTQCRVARWFGVGPRSVRRWEHGDRRVPCGVRIVFRLLAAGAVTIAQVEQAAVPSPIWTDEGAEEEPPAPPRAVPVPKQSASARAGVKIATLAGPGLTTAEKLCALTPETCHWPLGDPRDRDFRFCGAPAIEPPYCAHHRALAYLAPRPGRAHGVRVGFVAHGRHGRPSIPSAFSATSASRAPIARAALPSSAPPPV